MNDEEFGLSQLYQARALDLQADHQRQREVEGVIGRVREIFRNRGEDFDEGDERLLSSAPAKEPGFPVIIFTFAVIKDCLDLPLELSVIGILLTTLLSVLLSVILFLWVLGKLSGGWWKKKIIRWLWVRYLAVVVIELFPLFKIVPATTIFILMAHYREKKLVKLFDLALEEFRRAGVLKYIR